MKANLFNISITILLSQFAIADKASLRQRFSALKIDGVYPGDHDYEKFSVGYNKRLKYSPAGIIFPKDTDTVAKAITVANEEKLTVSPRSGGHSYAAYGLGGTDGVLVIDLKGLKSTTLNKSSGQATIGAGIRLGDMALNLYNQGKRALPHGTCPYVGLGGHVAFGGFGFSSRQWGLTLDNVISHEVVLGNGTIVKASKSTNSDLFWALRGAGASYGIMTQITFQTHPAPAQVTSFHYEWDLNKEDFASAMIKYQAFCMSNLPKELGVEATLSKGEKAGSITLELVGAWYGAPDILAKVFAPLLSQMPPTKNNKANTTDWLGSLRADAGSQALSSSALDLSSEHDTFYAKSLTTPISAPMTTNSFHAFSNYLANRGHQTKTNWFIQFELYGGEKSVITSVGEDDTSFSQRSILFTIQFYTSSPNYEPPFPQEGLSFLDNMVATIISNNPPGWQYGAYANYVDDRLSPSQWKSQYYKRNYGRLTEVKRKYDSKNVFFYPQSITEIQN